MEQNPSVNLSLKLSEVNTVLTGVAELPAKVSYDLINSIKAQAQTQLAQQAAAPVAEAAPAEPQLLTESQPAAEQPQG